MTKNRLDPIRMKQKVHGRKQEGEPDKEQKRESCYMTTSGVHGMSDECESSTAGLDINSEGW